ncbi:SGNH hydrolase [Penicillium hispanicum]|uniref:SGNH hydrolase n=1 Tax=Penicillium hispanicum TaxID=1080232 RepID=UPI0025400B8A|nr:SGNH hydrolase [Penicillium hispanicum]KAJ5573524.1 SGNH hydrolase [Penicillium hispanicum]
MTEELSILCFGNSLTAGFYCYGLEYHPYAGKMKESILAEFPTLQITTEVQGLPGDLVIFPPGSFLSRIQAKCAKPRYDWVIFLGGTNDIGYGHKPDRIYAALQDSWKVARDSGAKVLALTIPECAAASASLNTRRAELNALILAHQADGFYAFDLCSKIPYHAASETFREETFDDGLHLTAKGYDFMGSLVGEHLVALLKADMATDTV